ncbi:MAG: DNA-directed RNA polymerase subunit beta [Holosporales bacterium]|nr:DNA-directed RNA polymerase subunit beta [Holosporales bacterium]
MAERSFTERKRFRKSFGKITETLALPDLIELQRSSYEAFLQLKVLPAERTSSGLQGVFAAAFPVKDFSGHAQVDFCYYEFDETKYDEEECRQKGLTYAAPLRTTFRLIVWDVDDDTGAKTIRDIKEQAVYMGDMPLMTRSGTFIVNGIERVVVSQMQRSPGVSFDHDKGKTHSSGKLLFSAHIVPYRGSWLDFEFDAKDHLYVRIDRKRKVLATTFLMALDSAQTEALRIEREKDGKAVKYSEVTGMSREEILRAFYNVVIYSKTKKGDWQRAYTPAEWQSVKISRDLVDASSGQVIAKAGTKFTSRLAQKLYDEGLRKVRILPEELVGAYVADDFIDESNGLVLIDAGAELTEELLHVFEENGGKELATLAIDRLNTGAYIRDTLNIDKNNSREEALFEIYRVLRPGEPPTVDGAAELFRSLFFDQERYDLSAVGRVKLNVRLEKDTQDDLRTLTKDDVLRILKILHELKDGRGEIDDIDNLGNRRVRSVGELLENQFRIGLSRMERSIRERMGSPDVGNAMPNDIINAKPVSVAIREFFTSSQLSQFMDQTNPLAEITHKRRLSALGSGGLTRERAGFEVRDVHPTHYGRICPIETPEGPNIGLINSLATFARVNKYGFIESPYRKVVNGRVTDEIIYLSAMEEARHTIAQANAAQDAKGCFTDEFVICRQKGETINAPRDAITLVDVSTKQVVSVAASLIPFLENDDTSRALMGSNMQRQSVSLLRTEAPLVGTGMESVVARDSGVVVVAKRDGVVDQVDAQRIVVRTFEESDDTTVGVDIYNLRKFERSNQSTCINQKPLVRCGDTVKAGDIIADGPSTQLGELALGQNMLVAFMLWNGYGFEDAILLSERVVRDDLFTSIHIEEFEVMARDTKLGNEEITRDVPNVGDEGLRHLDEAGIVHVGAEVQAGDILVGKVTPKGESPMTPEEKLLRAIFGERASDVRDSSLRIPPGVYGTVVDVKVFTRRGVEKDERALAVEKAEIDALTKDCDAERSILERSFYAQMEKLLIGQIVANGPKGVTAGSKINASVLAGLSKGQWRQIVVEDAKVMLRIEDLQKRFDKGVEHLRRWFDNKVEKVRRGDDLMPGVLKMVKVFVAVKRKIQPGDKVAGRHGNKGVVSRILPIEDMPHLEDGTPVDIVLNPLGVPSRMNIGQILETHLGWASHALGERVRSILSNMGSAKKDIGALRQELKEIFGSSEDCTDIDALGDYEMVELATHLTRGIPMATPVFDGAHEDDIVEHLKKAGLDPSGQVTLYDGRTGEPFDRKVTVGYIYMLKLDHMIDDKLHARSIGPYSLVTQQPLGGKAQFGGQRFGEMEVWALQAYGASYTLQEMLTVKSDDITGRIKAYEAIVRGDENIECGIPESFRVLVKELHSLALNVEFHQHTLPEAEKSSEPTPESVFGNAPAEQHI